MAGKSIREAIADSATNAANAASTGETAPPPKMGEVAASVDGRDITVGFFGKLRPNQDTVLAARGGGLEIYEDVLRDTQCYSSFQQRLTAVTSREWGVDAGAKDKLSVMAADSLKAQIAAIGFDNATTKMLHGFWYGYSVGECLWGRSDREIILKKIKVKKARRFRYDADGRLRLLTREAGFDGEPMPDRKFWTFSTGADNDDDPYGIGLAHYCYWPVWLKKNGYRFWSMLLDKFGMPTGVGTYPTGASSEDQRKLLAAIAAIQSSSGIIVPEGMLIEFLEAQRSGSVNNEGFVDRMDDAISKVILSQTMTTDAKATGLGSSQGNVQGEVKDDVVKGDADLICASFNDSVAKWLTDWNYPGATPPKVWRNIEPPEDLDKRATRDKTIYDMGFDPTEEYIRETYGEGWTKRQDPKPASVLPGLPGNPLAPKKPVQTAPVEFAQAPATGDAATMLALQVDDAAAGAVNAMIDDIRRILDTSASLQEFERRLLLAYPSLSVADIAAAIRDGLIVADLTGRDDQTPA